MNTTSSLVRASIFFAVGYIAALPVVAFVGENNGWGWNSGLAAAGMSVPTAIIYFFGLHLLSRWNVLTSSSSGMALSGCICAFYPLFCGFFPVYFMRPQLGAVVFVLQFGFIVLIAAVCGGIEKRAQF